MLNFPQLLKYIRKEAGLTQDQLSKKIGVSKVLIIKIENESREPSKNVISRLAKALKVHPLSLTPFLYCEHETEGLAMSALETRILEIGEKLQEKLIKKRAHELTIA